MHVLDPDIEFVLSHQNIGFFNKVVALESS